MRSALGRNVSCRNDDKDSTCRLYRARTSLCSPDWLEDILEVREGSRVLIGCSPLDTACLDRIRFGRCQLTLL